MNCEQCEQYMADALGGELSRADLQAFDAHLDECPRCRAEFDSNSAAIAALRSVPTPPSIHVSREEDRLVLATSDGNTRGRRRRRVASLARYAACVIIAFVLGYVVRATGTPDPQSPDIVRHEERVEETDRDLVELARRYAMVDVFVREQSRPEFSKCMRILFGSKSR